MPTIREVAEHAQVSIATVSHVINRTRFVDPETQERVRQSIKMLGYRPNLLARSLRRRETRTIGLIVPDNANPFFADVARVIEDAGFAEGYSVILCNSDRSETKEETYIDVLLAKQVDGLIVISSTDRTDLLQHVRDVNVPLVVVDRDPGDLSVSQVLVANQEGGYLAGQYLVRDIWLASIWFGSATSALVVSAARARAIRAGGASPASQAPYARRGSICRPRRSRRVTSAMPAVRRRCRSCSTATLALRPSSRRTT
jgi:DNA-binding LacI/PurR family transcriptional regulator